jgi:type IV pilus assembly protein PilX
VRSSLPAPRFPIPARQRGMALITGLLLLLVVTIIAASMFRGFGTEEQIAGNTREKQRALNAAISAQQYGEWWLIDGSVPPTVSCSSVVSSDIGQVCTPNPQINFASVPWTLNGVQQVGVQYTPFAQSQTITGPNGTPSQGSYYGAPAFYITDLGSGTNPNTGTSGELYQVDAYGYGGTANAVAEVESTYIVTSQYGMRQLDIQK